MLLTLVGYLAAVSLGAVIYSMLARRRRHPAAQPAPVTMTTSEDSSATPSPQFMRLGTPEAEASRPAAASESDEHNDRVDIIRIAREMLKAGADKPLLFVKEQSNLLITDSSGHCQAN